MSRLARFRTRSTLARFDAAQDEVERASAEIISQLRTASISAGRRGDTISAGLLAAAKEVADEWHRRRIDSGRCRTALEEAIEREERTRAHLQALIRAAREVGETEPIDNAGSSGASDELNRTLVTPTMAASQATPPLGADPAAEDDAVPVREAVAPRSKVDYAVYLLDTFQLRRRGQESVDGWHGPKSHRLVRYIFAHHRRPNPSDVLVEHFWPNTATDIARRRLHQAVYTIRKALHRGEPDIEHIVFLNDSYLVNPDLVMWSDVEEFERRGENGRRAERRGDLTTAVAEYEIAERCYSGDYLADSPYEDWTITERNRLRLLYLDLANRLADLHEHAGNSQLALGVSRRSLQREPCDEQAHRRIMRCFAEFGQRTLAILQYEACNEALKRTYGFDPSPETVALFDSITR